MPAWVKQAIADSEALTPAQRLVAMSRDASFGSEKYVEIDRQEKAAQVTTQTIQVPVANAAA